MNLIDMLHEWSDARANAVPNDEASWTRLSTAEAALQRAADSHGEDGLENGVYIGLSFAQALAHKTATDAGWYIDPDTGNPITRNTGEVIALMHSELSEALEADRMDLMDEKLPHRPGIEVEFADCIIRILDTAAAMGLDVPGAFIEKNRYNQKRADHKIEARSGKHGKKY